MASYHTDDIRNIAVVGHGASGKTTVCDALLYRAGAVERRGSVDDGTSLSDYDDEEKKRHFSIDTSLLHLECGGKQVHLLDAPGYPDFVGAALESLIAVETALIVVSAPAGVEVNTRRMFAEAGRRGLARMIVINKLDADNVHFDPVVETLRQTFGTGCVLFNAPVGIGRDLISVVSVLRPPPTAPRGCLVDLDQARSRLIDAVVESDDALMEKYLVDGDISPGELEKAVPAAIAAGKLIPIFCISAKKDIGTAELLSAVCEFALSPLQGPVRTAENGAGRVPITPTEAGEFTGQVFKAVTDRFVGHLSYFRVLTGTLHAEQPIINLRTGKSARAPSLLLVQGKSQKPIREAIAGDIVAVAKIDDLVIGDTLSTDSHAPRLPRPEFPTPMYGLAVEPRARGDEQKISGSLHKIADEDPTFRVSRDAQTHELVITGMSQLHLEVIRQRLKKRFDLDVVTHEPKVPYRETIQAEAEASYRHKKQTGGRGQFAEVHLRIYPLSREFTSEHDVRDRFAADRFEKLRAVHYDAEHNFAFLDTVVGGTIPNQFIPAIEKGCKELLEQGALAGYRIQDVAVEVYFGKYHDVDSSEAAFKTAGRRAMKAAFLAAKPTLLEPVVKLEVTVPTKYTGAILGDLNNHRARIEHQESLPGDVAVITAKAPLAEVTRYAAQLGSITQGQGTYQMEFDHYDVVPGTVQQQIVSKAKLHVEEDE